jgi:hypothetical protein
VGGGGRDLRAMSTGLSVLSTDLAGQRLDLLREITSEIRRVTDIAPAIHALKGDADALCLLRPAHIQQLELHQHLGVIDPFRSFGDQFCCAAQQAIPMSRRLQRAKCGSASASWPSCTRLAELMSARVDAAFEVLD